MAKKVIGFIKLHVTGGQANPAPPVGPALGQQGVNIMEFCKQFNSKTKQQNGVTIPVEISVAIIIDALRGLHAAHTARSKQGR
ncbi:MAG TPA: hypothetical protein EYQ27_12550, partial [Gemmatimonadetes bacterium]|nr:hypothetical protein [Gemmatimonadota bacterium]